MNPLLISQKNEKEADCPPTHTNPLPAGETVLDFSEHDRNEGSTANLCDVPDGKFHATLSFLNSFKNSPVMPVVHSGDIPLPDSLKNRSDFIWYNDKRFLGTREPRFFTERPPAPHSSGGNHHPYTGDSTGGRPILTGEGNDATNM